MKYFFLLLSLLPFGYCYSQYLYITSDRNDIYRFDLSGSCSATFFSNCTPAGSTVQDIAVTAFGKLYICRNDSIFLFDEANSSCVFVTAVAGDNIKSIEIGPEGRLYAVSKDLLRYDLNTGAWENLGHLPQGIPDASSIVFYLTRLFMSTIGGSIYEINIGDPSSSNLYYDPKIKALEGLVVAPARCAGAASDELRMFAFENNSDNHSVVHIIDMEKKITYYNYCTADITITGNTGFHPAAVVTSPMDMFMPSITPASCPKSSDGKIDFTVNNIPAITDFYSFSINNTIENSTGVFTNLKSGTYPVRVQNKTGCFKDTIIVVPTLSNDCRDSLFVPTAFTPDNDGRNDIFRAHSFISFNDFQMQIFNRDGQKIFQSNSIINGWDGKMKGDLQTAGVYIWLIRYRNLNDQVVYRRGYVLLIH